MNQVANVERQAPGIKRVPALTSSAPAAPVPMKQAEASVIAAPADAYLDAILRAARDPSVDIDKMERLMRMREQMLAEEAKKTFIRAKIKMRPALPKIEKRGEIIICEKGTNKVIQSTTFAKFEDIHDAVMPVLNAHGFDLDYIPGSREGRLTVTAVLRHDDGHCEEATLEGPLDTSGSKNNVQGIGSTLSYLKRYTMCAILNIRTADKGEFDDDGHAAGIQDDRISDDQVSELREALFKSKADLPKFLRFAKVDDLSDILAKDYAGLCQEVQQTAARRGR